MSRKVDPRRNHGRTGLRQRAQESADGDHPRDPIWEPLVSLGEITLSRSCSSEGEPNEA